MSVSLHLCHQAPSSKGAAGNDDDAKARRNWLDKIGASLERVVAGAEARMWLITSLSSVELGSRGSQAQMVCFLDLLQNTMRDSSRFHDGQSGPLELQFARLLIENKPGLALRLINDDTSMFRRLFSGNSKRIRYWFDRFGQTEHHQGARALANFAFRNRDLCWHQLSWQGKHAHSPSTLAAKPHYFMELDVLTTVDNFLQSVPEFWRSQEFQTSLESTTFWSTDITFFSQYLATKLSNSLDSYTSESEHVWATVRDCLTSIPFSTLCQQLLHVVSDGKLLTLINDLGSFLKKKGKARKSSNWMEVTIHSAVQWKTVSEILFINACVKHSRKLLRVLQEEEHEETAKGMKMLMEEEKSGDEHWAMRERMLKMSKGAACRYIALEAWVLFYELSREDVKDDVYEGLLEESGIQYKRRERVNRKRKKRSSKRSRKRKHRRRDSEDDESGSDVELLGEAEEEEQGWLLSIDNYNLTWTKADLAEELTGIAVQAWLDWLSGKWQLESIASGTY